MHFKGQFKRLDTGLKFAVQRARARMLIQFAQKIELPALPRLAGRTEEPKPRLARFRVLRSQRSALIDGGKKCRPVIAHASMRIAWRNRYKAREVLVLSPQPIQKP